MKSVLPVCRRCRRSSCTSQRRVRGGCCCFRGLGCFPVRLLMPPHRSGRARAQAFRVAGVGAGRTCATRVCLCLSKGRAHTVHAAGEQVMEAGRREGGGLQTLRACHQGGVPVGLFIPFQAPNAGSWILNLDPRQPPPPPCRHLPAHRRVDRARAQVRACVRASLSPRVAWPQALRGLLQCCSPRVQGAMQGVCLP